MKIRTGDEWLSCEERQTHLGSSRRPQRVSRWSHSPASCSTARVHLTFHICQSWWNLLLESLAMCGNTTIIGSGNTKGQKLPWDVFSGWKAKPLCSGLVLGGHCIPASLEHSLAVDRILAGSVQKDSLFIFASHMKIVCVGQKLTDM